MDYSLGKLEKIINLREIWKNEVNDIKLLSEELVLNITADEIEASTGSIILILKFMKK